MEETSRMQSNRDLCIVVSRKTQRKMREIKWGRAGMKRVALSVSFWRLKRP